MKKIIMFGLLLVAVILVSGCTQRYGGAPQPAAPTPTKAPAAAETLVTVEHTKFTPSTLTIKKGTTVTWKNLNSMNHPVAVEGLFDSGFLGLDQKYSYTFNNAGTFTIVNTAHGVTMKITVTE